MARSWRWKESRGTSRRALRPKALRPGHYVRLSVRDTGGGMDEATQSRIFEPFFTTKALGQGTGLGLATVYGIVRQSDGEITVHSRPGAGTELAVYLPAQRSEPAPAEEADHALVTGGDETILVVEDEQPVLSLACRVLRRAGYRVLAAADGQDAIEVAARYEGPIHLLLTDVVMPNLGGRQLAEWLRHDRPDLTVLYMSGYTDDVVVRHGVEQNGSADFLQKPFGPTALLNRIRDLLRRG